MQHRLTGECLQQYLQVADLHVTPTCRLAILRMVVTHLFFEDSKGPICFADYGDSYHSTLLKTLADWGLVTKVTSEWVSEQLKARFDPGKPQVKSIAKPEWSYFVLTPYAKEVLAKSGMSYD